MVAKVLGNKFEYIKFVKIDGELNSDELVPQRGYPFIRLYRKDDGENYVQYEGFYSARELAQWICDMIGVENPFEEIIAQMKNRKNEKKYEDKQDI